MYVCSESKGICTVFLYRLSKKTLYLIFAIERVVLAERDSGAKSRRRVNYWKSGCVFLITEA